MFIFVFPFTGMRPPSVTFLIAREFIPRLQEQRLLLAGVPAHPAPEARLIIDGDAFQRMVAPDRLELAPGHADPAARAFVRIEIDNVFRLVDRCNSVIDAGPYAGAL